MQSCKKTKRAGVTGLLQNVKEWLSRIQLVREHCTDAVSGSTFLKNQDIWPDSCFSNNPPKELQQKKIQQCIGGLFNAASAQKTPSRQSRKFVETAAGDGKKCSGENAPGDEVGVLTAKQGRLGTFGQSVM